MTVDAYRPGACNIGPFELARRRRSAVAFTLLAVVVAGVILASGLPVVARLGVFPFAAAAAITWLQVGRRFCVAFAAIGIRNFGRRSDAETIDDPEAVAADRWTALRMVIEGCLYGALVTAALLVIPT